MYKEILNNIVPCKEDMRSIEGKKVKNISNFKDDIGEGVEILFSDDDGNEVRLAISDNGEIHISSPRNVSPVCAMQWFRDLIGYRIVDVASDDNDANGLIYLSKEDEGEVVTIQIDDKVLDGESIYVITDVNP